MVSVSHSKLQAKSYSPKACNKCGWSSERYYDRSSGLSLAQLDNPDYDIDQYGLNLTRMKKMQDEFNKEKQPDDAPYPPPLHGSGEEQQFKTAFENQVISSFMNYMKMLGGKDDGSCGNEQCPVHGKEANTESVNEVDTGDKYSRVFVGESEDGTPAKILGDVYTVLRAYRDTIPGPGVDHAIKKLLMAGERGSKSVIQDLQEAIVSIQSEIDDLKSS